MSSRSLNAKAARRRSSHFEVGKSSTLLMLALCCVFLSSACSKLQTFEQLTALKSDKEEMLGERLSSFKKAVYWGSFAEAGGLMDPSIRRDYVNLMKRRKRSERFVDIEVDKIDFNEGSDEAVVDLYIRYYGKPTYLVNERVERFTWKYDRLGGGWFAHEFEEVDLDSSRNAGSSSSTKSRASLKR